MFSRSGQLGRMPLRLPLLGEQADARRDRVMRRAECQRLAVPGDRRLHRRRRSPPMARAISFWPAPSSPVSARISPRRASKETSRTRVPSRRPATSSAGLAGGARGADVTLGLAADHRVGQPRLGPAGEVGRDDLAPVAQHGDAVAERQNLGEAVRDVEDGDALRLQAARWRRTAAPTRAGRAARSARRG